MVSKMVKTQLFNSGGVVKWAYFQKKVEYPFKTRCKQGLIMKLNHTNSFVNQMQHYSL